MKGRVATIALAAILPLASCGSGDGGRLPSATGTEVAPVPLVEGVRPSDDRPSSPTAEDVVSRPDEAGAEAASGGRGDVSVAVTDVPPDNGDGGDDDGSAGDNTATTGKRPTPAQIAALVGRELTILGDDAQHAVVDVDDDGVDEVVIAGVLDDEVTVGLWRWEHGAGYGQPAVGRAGPGRAVTDLRVADVTDDGSTDLLLRIGGGGRESLALWSLAVADEIAPHTAVGGCFDGTHVFGATGARLQQRPGGPPAVLAVCDDSPLPLKDWATVTYEFVEGAYHALVAAPVLAPPPMPTDPDPLVSENGVPLDDDNEDDDRDVDGEGGVDRED